MSEQLPIVSEVDQRPSEIIVFGDKASFELSQRMAKLLADSELVPKQYQGNVANCTIALEMAMRVKASPLMVMQNLHPIQGKPSWSSQFIISALNVCGRFSPLRFDMKGEGMKRECIAWAVEKATGERLESPTVSMEMAKAEGWLNKNGSKWQTMPELMLRYRAAAFFGRLYAPELLMGMHTQEELIDMAQPIEKPVKPSTGVSAAKELLSIKPITGNTIDADQDEWTKENDETKSLTEEK